jgi:predicted metal-dependent hydrolase
MGYPCIRGKNGVNVKIDQIIRSKRKTISLELKQDGALIARVPLFTSRDQINGLVKSKENWIRKKQELLKSQSLDAPAKKFIPGEQYLYLGKLYTLDIVEAQTAPLILKDKFYLVEKSLNEAKEIFIAWYRKQAIQIINELVKRRAEENNYSYKLVRITNAKKRWGSCGLKGSLNFTWRLIMAPQEVIDYVVAHEMVHLKIMNHSKIYWNEVERIIPLYQHQKAWLKENGHRLTLD